MHALGSGGDAFIHLDELLARGWEKEIDLGTGADRSARAAAGVVRFPAGRCVWKDRTRRVAGVLRARPGLSALRHAQPLPHSRRNKGTEMISFKTTVLALGVLASSLVEAHAAGFYVARSTVAIPMATQGGAWTEVVSFAVGNGTWVLHSTASPVNGNTNDIVRCGIFIDDEVNVSNASVLGELPQAITAEISNLAVVALYAGQVVSLRCEHDSTKTGLRVDPGATLVATRAPAK
jgi:hypothetical protein